MELALRKAGFKTSEDLLIEDLKRQAEAEGVPLLCVVVQTLNNIN